MKFAYLILCLSLSISLTSSFRLLEAKTDVPVVTYEEVVVADENPDVSVIIPEELYEEPPMMAVEQVVAEKQGQDSEPIVAYIALTAEQAAKLNLSVNSDVVVESVGASAH